MRRLLTALTAALLVAGALPATALAVVPVAADLFPATLEDQAVTITLSATDEDGDPVTAFTITSVGQPDEGTLGDIGPIDCTGSAPLTCTAGVVYTPNPNASGIDGFSYTATAGGEESENAFVSITVTAVNDVPSFTKGPDILAPTTSPVVRAGWATSLDAGAGESDTLTFELTPANPALFSEGPAVDGGTGDLTFTPSGTSGSTTVQVRVVDDGDPPKASPNQSFKITLADDPVADPQSVTVAEDSASNPITLTGAGPQDDPLTFSIVTPPAHGTLQGSGAAREYTPAANYVGPDSFTFTVSDGTHTSAPATVSITVIPGNDDPVLAKSDFVTVTATKTTTLNPLANDSGGAGETLEGVTIVSVTKPSLGKAAITSGGLRVSYDPTGCAVGKDGFEYTISDGSSTSTKSVGVTINRPGQGGLPTKPITDTPLTAFVTGSQMGTTVPVKVSWCGVTTSSTSVAAYRLAQSINGGTWTTLISSTRSRSSTRNVSVGRDYRWKVRTTDSRARVGAYASSVATRVTRYQDTSSRITYAGTWSTSTSGSPSGGSQRFTSRAGASATISVTGVRAIAIVGPRSATRGSFRVYVDGALVKTVSEKASTSSPRRVLYWRSVSTSPHTIKLEAVGDGRVDLDAILTMSTP